jgi:uncharacterized protein YlxW (UPF0749 family)
LSFLALFRALADLARGRIEERSMTVRKSNKMDEAEIFRRAQEPGDRATQRKQDAKSFLKDLQARDDDMNARMAKLKALRLAAAPPPSEAPVKARAKAVKKPVKALAASAAR